MKIDIYGKQIFYEKESLLVWSFCVYNQRILFKKFSGSVIILKKDVKENIWINNAINYCKEYGYESFELKVRNTPDIINILDILIEVEYNNYIKKYKQMILNDMEQTSKTCMRCNLCGTRKNVVFGDGNVNCDVMFIGEGPGINEDIQGIPFVGRSGTVLDAMIHEYLEMSRMDVYVHNMVMCRATIDNAMIKDRQPNTEELKKCRKYVDFKIDVIKPKVIITLGNIATQNLLGIKDGMIKVLGNKYLYKNIPVYPVYHPSYILKNGGVNSKMFQEMEKIFENIKKVLN